MAFKFKANYTRFFPFKLANEYSQLLSTNYYKKPDILYKLLWFLNQKLCNKVDKHNIVQHHYCLGHFQSRI